MNLGPLYLAIDARPFQPFSLSLTSGEKIRVTHPDNIFVLPARHRVFHIIVYKEDGSGGAMIYPEALVALHFRKKKTALS